MFKSNWKMAALAGLGLSFGYGQSADAELLVYEGFNYGTAGTVAGNSDDLAGQPDDLGGTDTDALGLSGSWYEDGDDETNNHFVVSGSLVFGDLSTSGNSIRSTNNANYDRTTRAISADLDSGGEMWFSFLANKLANNFSAAEGGLVIGSGALPVTQGRVLETDPAGYHGFAIAPTTAGNNWTAYAWDGTSTSVGDAAFGVDTDGTETNLLIGKVVFDVTGETDEFSIYRYQLNAGEIDGGTLAQIGTTMSVDVDETALNTLILARQVNTAYDEIRIGTTLDDVLGVPEPGSLALLAMGGLLIARRRRG